MASPHLGAARGGPAPRHGEPSPWPPLLVSFGLRVRVGKIGTSVFVASNSENISRTTFLKPKIAENRELVLWHLVNRLVAENI